MENPLLAKEVLTALRTRKAVAFAIVFLAALAALVILLWPAEGAMSLAAQASHELFILLAMGQLLFVLMVVPAFTAVSITSEKEAETYDLLYHTMLRPGQILTAKFLAGAGFAGLLLLAALPMMGACLVLGGVGLGDVLGVYAVLGLTILLLGLAGLYCSCLFRTSYRALIFCYVAVLSLAGLTWLPSLVLGSWALGWSAPHLFRALSPVAAMTSIVNPGLFAAEHPGGIAGLARLADGPVPFLLGATFASLLLALFALRQVARPPQPRRRRDERIVDERVELLKRRLRFPFYLFDPRRRKRMIGPILNIVAVKEMRTKAFGRVSWMARAVYVSVTVSLVLAFLPLLQLTRDPGQIGAIVLVCVSLPLGLILLVSPVLTATAISEERESGVFDALRMTPLPSLSIVLGKLEVAWFFAGLLLFSTFPTFLVLAILGSSTTEVELFVDASRRLLGGDPVGCVRQIASIESSAFYGMFRTLGVALADLFFATAAGICASTFFRRSSAATSAAYALVLAVGFGTLVPYFIASGLPLRLVESLLVWNPFAAAGKAASDTVFVQFRADLWFAHILRVGGLGAALLTAAAVRVRQLMRPQR